MYIPRVIEEHILDTMKHNPVTGITGPRQCGKSTLAKKILDPNKPLWIKNP